MAAIGGFEPYPTLAVALSGGADSMALALLAQGWAKAQQGRLLAFTVDHGLRAEASQEAGDMQSWCKTHGIEHHIRTWQHTEKPHSAIQEAARDARYGLLAAACREHGAAHLLTGHHANDQAETLFFRLARGSGLDGLACMQPISTLGNIRLLRPLLAFPKSHLVAFLRRQNECWIEDPSNADMRYTRSRIRALLAQTGEEDAIAERVYHITRSLKNFRNLLKDKLASELTSCIRLQPQSADIDLVGFLKLEPEMRARLLAHAILHIGGKQHKPRTHKLARLHHAILHRDDNWQATLGGCVFTCKQDKKLLQVRLEKSPARII